MNELQTYTYQKVGAFLCLNGFIKFFQKPLDMVIKW